MPYILVVNAGSSSLKFSVFAADMQLIGKGSGTDIARWLAEGGIDLRDIRGVGHRMVHGGRDFILPTIVDDAIEAQLQELVPLVPLHMPVGLAVLRDMRKLLPDAVHVACFDTAFHATLDDFARRLPLPRAYHDRGYQRYGFHGLSYEHVVQALPTQTRQPLPKRLLVAHLGNGASMCAIRDGRSIATTMGYSTADGLVMGTRTGAIDPGVLVALMRDDGLTAEGLEDLLYRQSGLLGISGVSSDMRELLARDDANATEAVNYYCYHAARHAGSLAVAMGGVDAIAFTGGIGENSEIIRTKIMSHLSWLSIGAVYVVKADEELAIATHVKDLLAK
jgi:acetate kinase